MGLRPKTWAGDIGKGQRHEMLKKTHAITYTDRRHRYIDIFFY